jgi:hypothetical protein
MSHLEHLTSCLPDPVSNHQTNQPTNQAEVSLLLNNTDTLRTLAEQVSVNFN